MMKKHLRMSLVLLLCLLVILPNHAQATGINSDLTASTSGSISSSDLDPSDGTLSMTVNGARTSAKNGTLTLMNEGEVSAMLSFSYSASGTYDSFTVAGASASVTGTYNAEIAAGAQIAIYMNVPKSGILSSAKSASVTLSNVKLEVVSASNLTIAHNGLGTVSVGGNTVDSGTTVEVAAEGTSLTATPASGAIFLGWVNTADNSVYSTSASLNYIPTGEASLKAIFAAPSAEACFWGSAKSYLFEGLSAAISHASSASNKTIILAGNGTLSAGDYTIPSGVTLLIPFDSAGTCYTSTPGYVEDSWSKPSAYHTMTMDSGANVAVNGAISVSAKVSAKMGYAGAPTSTYGHIAMNSGSSITVNNGANLYAWGYITGSGNVTIESGASVYESFQVVDWRGGTASSGMLNNKNKVFPMTQYYIQNVEAPMTLKSGASEKCSMVADIISVRQVTVSYLGSSGCMFNLTSGSVTKQYDGTKDRLVLDVNGELSVSQTTINLILTYSIATNNYVLPFNSNITVNVNSGSTVAFAQTASLLPGVQINIAEGATAKLGSGAKLFVYDDTEWKSEYYVYSNAYFRPVRYAHSKTYTRTAAADIIDAQILVNGTLDASAGYLYTTASGANICSTGNGVVKTQAAESSPTLYEAVQSGTSISYSDIPITAAKLKNADGNEPTFVQSGANTYTYTDGYWHCETHSGVDTDHTCDVCVFETSCVDTDGDLVCDVCSAAMCAHDQMTAHEAVEAGCEAGNSAYWQCNACEKYFSDAEGTTEIEENSWVIEGTGHTYGEADYKWADDYSSCTVTLTCDVCAEGTENKTLTATDSDLEPKTTAGTCQSEAKTTYTVSVELNGQTYTKSETVTGEKDTTNHTNIVTDAAVAGSCTEDGKTEGSHCGDCGAVIVAQETVAANGHNEITVPGKAATCTETGLTDGVKCGVCGEVIKAQEEIPVKDHTAAAAVVENEVAATCGKAGSYESVVKCSVCNKELSRTKVDVPATGKHTAGDAKVENEKAATCTAEGSYESVVKCTVCGTEMSRETVTVDKIAHSYEATVTAPTCTEAGYTTYTCTACGDTYKGDDVAATGHTPGAAATCTTAQICTVCKVELAPATGNHSYTVKQSETPATCAAKGSIVWKCATCDATNTEELAINADNHTALTQVSGQAATCTESGYADYEKCDACGHSTYKTVAALGHTSVTDAAVEATCTATGLTEGSHCGVCGEVITAQEEISALGHKMEETAAAVAPTCEAAGKTAVLTCANGCGKTEGGDEVAALQHDWDDGAVTTDPTCTEAGVKTYTCQNDNSHTKTEPVAALQHDLVDVEGKAATCTEDGYTAYKDCSRCDYTEGKEIIKAGHTLTQVEAKAPTCTEIGWDAYVTCSRCDYTTYVEKAKLDHSYTGAIKSDGNGKDATHSFKCVNGCDEYGAAVAHTWNSGVVTTEPKCETEGVKTYTCTANGCGAIYTEAIEATGHKNTSSKTVQNADRKTHTTTVTCDCGHVVSTVTADCTDGDDVDNKCDACGRELGYAVTITNKTTSAALATIKVGDTVVEGSATIGADGKFTVTCEKACVVIVATEVTDDTTGETTTSYVKLPATATKDQNAYEFVASNLSGGEEIIVVLKGDLNMNGDIIAREARYALQASSEMRELTAVEFIIADLDGSGTITAREARYILQASSEMRNLTW